MSWRRLNVADGDLCLSQVGCRQPELDMVHFFQTKSSPIEGWIQSMSNSGRDTGSSIKTLRHVIHSKAAHLNKPKPVLNRYFLVLSPIEVKQFHM